MIASTVGELVSLLSKLDQSATVITIEPPFDGVKLVPQGSGKVLICRPRAPENKSVAAK